MMPGFGVCGGILRQCVVRVVTRQSLHCAPVCRAAGGPEGSGGEAFDTSVLELLVCPLSRKPLRHDRSANELVNDELGIAYPIVDGIPNMIPQDARMIRKEQKSQEPDKTQQ